MKLNVILRETKFIFSFGFGRETFIEIEIAKNISVKME